MEPEFEIVVDPATLRIGSHGSITGVLAVHCKEFWFPEEGWSDFPIIVLGWWSRETAALRSGSPATFRFMDGPLWLLARPAGTTASVEFLEQGSSRTVTVAECVVPVAAVVGAVGAASRTLLSACDTRGWNNQDIAELRTWAAP